MLAISVFIRFSFTPASYLFIVLEKQQFSLFLNIISTILIVISLAIGYLFKEIIVTLVLISFFNATLYAFMGYYMFNLIGLKFFEVINPFIKKLPMALIVFLIIYLAESVLILENIAM